MKIEHIGLFVKDLEGARQFYETYFNGVAGGKYQNEKTHFQSYFISFTNGARLEIMTRPEVSGENNLYPLGFAHLAFSLGSKEKVDTLTNQLKKDGYQIINGPRTTGDGYYESVALDPEGNQLELTV